MDAFNRDQLEQGIADGVELNEKQRTALKELKARQPQMGRLMTALRDESTLSCLERHAWPLHFGVLLPEHEANG
jgi:hypothetical protein